MVQDNRFSGKAVPGIAIAGAPLLVAAAGTFSRGGTFAVKHANGYSGVEQ
jgi:hypothetical protein